MKGAQELPVVYKILQMCISFHGRFEPCAAALSDSAATRVVVANVVQVHSQKDLEGQGNVYKTLTWERYLKKTTSTYMQMASPGKHVCGGHINDYS